MSATSPERIQVFSTKWGIAAPTKWAMPNLIDELCGPLDVEPPQAGTGDEGRNA